MPTNKSNLSNKSIPDGGKSVYQVTVKTDHARHPHAWSSIFHPMDNVGPRDVRGAFSLATALAGNPPPSREGGREGQIICIEPPLPSGRSRINIRWLISFHTDQGVAFLKFSRQIVPSRGNRPFSPSFAPPPPPPQRFADPPCRLVALFPPAEVISTCRPRSSSILAKAAIVDGIIGRNIPGIGGARDMSLEMKRSVDRILRLLAEIS